MKTIPVFTAVLLFAAVSALSEEAPKPPVELSQLKFFVGNWTCSGNAPASAFGPAHKSEAAVTARWDLLEETCKKAGAAKASAPKDGAAKK